MNRNYVKDAITVTKEAEKLLKAVQNCLEKSDAFPIYLSDLQDMIDNLMYLNVAHNAVKRNNNPNY
jgi:hypothetical protein